MKRLLPALIAIAALTAAAWWYWGPRSAEAEASAPATVAARIGRVERAVLATGVIEAENLLSVGARVSGQIEELAVDVGDDVKAGDLIARIDSQDQQNQVLRARAALAKIEAQISAKQASIREAGLSVARLTTLNAKNLSATQDLEAAEAALDVARAELQGLEADRSAATIEEQSAELALARTRITAPAAGTVVAVVTGEGQTVNAASNTPTIVKLAQLDRMLIKADVSEADVVRVAPGQKASFALLGEPDQRYQATVDQIEPAPATIRDSDTIDTTQAIYYRAVLHVANADRKLRIGMTAEVTIRLAEADGVLTVPVAVLGARNADGSYPVEVWLPAEQRRERRDIRIGLTDTLLAEVTGGLAEGDLVVADRQSGVTAATQQMRRPPGVGF